MKVVILCGGLGTRMMNETEYRPKPLADVGGRPILWHIMKLYAHYGFSEFVLCLGYRGTMIKEYFLNYEAVSNDFTICLGKKNEIRYHGAHEEQNFKVTLVDTGRHTMTGGRILRIRDHVGDEPFMMTYGDGVADVDIQTLLGFHLAHRKIATMTTVHPFSRFGCVEADPDNLVTAFKEKGRIESWVNAGFFVFNPSVFNLLDGDTCVLEGTPLERLAAMGELSAYRHAGFFFAMDTPRDHSQLNDMVDSGNAPWMVWNEKAPPPCSSATQSLPVQETLPFANA